MTSILVALMLVIFPSCGGGGSQGSPPPASNPVPSIVSLSPASATAGAAAQKLTIDGSNFLASSTVTYNALAHAATFVNSTQLTISLTAGDQATAGTFPVVVANPAPGGGPSNAVNFTVNRPGQPVISSVSPMMAQDSQTITISGTGFGNTPPKTITLGDGSIDTVGCNTSTPSLVISDGGAGKDAWAAGHQTCNNTDAIGVYLVSWTDSQIVLSGFGSALGTTSSSLYQIAAGDPISIDVTGPNGTGDSVYNTTATLAIPVFSTTAAQNGAVILAMSSTTNGAAVHYTIDGSTPTTSSPTYQTPMLISSNLTINAIATASGVPSSSVATWAPLTTVAPGALVWSDEFTNTTGANAQPNPAVWTYDTGEGGWGNSELEYYCGWDSSASPCDPTNPNVYVGTDGYLHIVAEQPSSGVYTSARMKSEGLFSILYGRVEARIMVPEAQGFWPAFWMLGNNFVTDGWPACGEADIQERVDAASNPDWNQGSIHGTGFTGQNLGTTYHFPSGQTAADWHTYGMIWQPGSVQYYIDDPANIYATFTPASLTSLTEAAWPFDSGNAQFFILNLAVGGSWPGNPNGSTPFPSETLVDYVRVYAYGNPVP